MKLLGAPHLFIRVAGIVLCVLNFFAFAGTGMAREQMEKGAKLKELLSSSDAEERFEALSLKLRSDDVAQLLELQESMKVGARQAQQLADEIKKHEAINQNLREQRERDRQTAEAIANLLNAEVGRVAELIERRGRRSQWLFLVVGAILGVAFQALAQWIF